jgi:hypothetical protein
VRLSKTMDINRVKIRAETDTSVSTAFTVVNKMLTELKQFSDTLKRHFFLGVIKDCSDLNTSPPNNLIKNKANVKNSLVILNCCYYLVMA